MLEQQRPHNRRQLSGSSRACQTHTPHSRGATSDHAFQLATAEQAVRCWAAGLRSNWRRYPTAWRPCASHSLYVLPACT